MVGRSERESILRGIRGAKRLQRDLRLDVGASRAQRVDVFGCIARSGATLMFQPLEPLLGAFIREEGVAGIILSTRRPLGIGATSCAILAQMPEAEASALIEVNAPSYARYGQSKAQIEAVVAAARTQGYAFFSGPVIPESRTLAVALPQLDGIVAPMSISIVAFDSRLAEPRRSEVAEILRSEAATLTKG